MKFCSVFIGALSALFFLSSCESTLPSAKDMDRFYVEAQRRAKLQIEDLTAQRDQGRLTPEEYDYKVSKVNDEIPKKAADLAWTRHELVESQMRSEGVPTGDHPIYFPPPAMGSINGSLYRAPGDPNGNTNNQTFTPPTSGYTPGSIAGMAAGGGGGR